MARNRFLSDVSVSLCAGCQFPSGQSAGELDHQAEDAWEQAGHSRSTGADRRDWLGRVWGHQACPPHPAEVIWEARIIHVALV